MMGIIIGLRQQLVTVALSDYLISHQIIMEKVAHPTKSVAGLNQTPTIPDRKRTECPLPHAVGF